MNLKGHAEHVVVGRIMEIYGGSFFGALGKALQYADSNNQRKIKETWPEEYQRYLEMGTMLMENEK